jgi:hypothetical protein
MAMMTRRFWACASITVVSALVSVGYSIAAVLGQSGSDSFATYAASRSIALLIGVAWSVGIRSRAALVALAVTMSAVQGFDAVIGLLAHDPAKTYGPLVLAVANVSALIWFARESYSHP